MGGGILVCVSAPRTLAAEERLPSAYVQVAADGAITILTGKVEYGQGVMTSLAQMAAEELDAPLSSMRIIMGDTQLCPPDADGGTYGSLTTRSFGPVLRTAAAKARAVLVQLGSQQLGLARDNLITRDGYVISAADENVRVSYADLAGGKNVVVQLTQAVVAKSHTRFTLSGKPVPRLDGVEKVTGRAKYTADIRAPGMLYGYMLRPPARGAILQTADTTAAEAVPGVRLIRSGTLIAVLHEQPDEAARALKLIQAEYSATAATPNEETVYSTMASTALSQTLGPSGSLAAGEAQAVSKSDQTYYTPYVAHASIEPHAALAVPDGTRFTVWASTQTPDTAAREAGAARLITPCIGGAFGGKNYNQQVREAVQLARLAKAPVSLAWTREEEFLYDVFQCPSMTRIRSGVGSDGKITFLDCQVYWVGSRGATVVYEIPNRRVRIYGNYDQARPFAGGAWRAPGANANVFARESNIDTLAAAAGIDPVQFRLNHLQGTSASSTRLRKTLQTAAQAFGWTPAKGPSGRGYGVACGEDAETYVVTMAELAVVPATGEIKVKRVLCAQDMGQVINPEGAKMQMEGSMMMGLGYALSEEIHFAGTRVRDLNFHKYALPRFSALPKLEAILVENNALAPKGGGEPPIITMGAVLANAVFDATGVRLTRLPMTPDRVLSGLQQNPSLTLNPPERLPGQIRFTWNGGPGIRLQKSPSLSSPVWQDVPDTEGASGVTLPASDASAFFRLAKP